MPIIAVSPDMYDIYTAHYRRISADIINDVGYKLEFIGFDNQYYRVELSNAELLEKVIESKHFEEFTVCVPFIYKIYSQLISRGKKHNARIVYIIWSFVNCLFNDIGIEQQNSIYMEHLMNIGIDWCFGNLIVGSCSVVFDGNKKKQVDIKKSIDIADKLVNSKTIDNQDIKIIESLLA